MSSYMVQNLCSKVYTITTIISLGTKESEKKSGWGGKYPFRHTLLELSHLCCRGAQRGESAGQKNPTRTNSSTNVNLPPVLKGSRSKTSHDKITVHGDDEAQPEERFPLMFRLLYVFSPEL